MKRLKRRILAGLLAFVMCISTVNVTAFAQENETSSEIQETVAVSETGSSNEASTENIEITDTYVSGNNVEPVEEKLLNENQEQLTNEKIYENENYNVTFSLTSSWESGYNANVKIENTGDDTIQNWYLSFEYDDQITNIWNAEISTHEENQYIVKNAGWNQDIVAGGSIEFGISGSTAFNEFPENFNVVGENKEVQEEDYSVHYQVDSDWGSGFTGSIQITNNTDKILEDWVLEFDFEREITNIWNAVIECHEGNHYVIRNAGYNANINAGQMVSFGFNGMNGSKDIVPEVYKYTCNCHGDNSIDTITVTNYGISKDSREKAIAKIPSNALPYCTITRYDGWLVGGWNFDNCQTPAYFMQILAAQMSGELTKKQFVVDINIAKRYENAKTAVIKSAIGGLSHPHYTESYYILSNNLTNGAFK